MKLKEIINRYKSYEEMEEFQILIVHLRTISEKLENIVINRNNMATQVNRIIFNRYFIM